MICGGQRSTGTGFLPALPFFLPVSFHQCSILIYMLLLPGRQTEDQRPSNNNALLEIGERRIAKCFHILSSLNGKVSYLMSLLIIKFK